MFLKNLFYFINIKVEKNNGREKKNIKESSWEYFLKINIKYYLVIQIYFS